MRDKACFIDCAAPNGGGIWLHRFAKASLIDAGTSSKLCARRAAGDRVRGAGLDGAALAGGDNWKCTAFAFGLGGCWTGVGGANGESPKGVRGTDCCCGEAAVKTPSLMGDNFGDSNWAFKLRCGVRH